MSFAALAPPLAFSMTSSSNMTGSMPGCLKPCACGAASAACDARGDIGDTGGVGVAGAGAGEPKEPANA